MTRETRVDSWSNETSDRIEETSDKITEVIPRDTNTHTERYIIFTDGDLDTLPRETRQVIDELGFNIRDMDEHALEYRHKDTMEFADFLAR